MVVKEEKIMKVSEFFSQEMEPAILGAFFRRTKITKNGKYLYAYFSFRKSRYCDISLEQEWAFRKDFCDNLNKNCQNHPFWIVNSDADEDREERELLLELGISNVSGVFLLENDVYTEEEYFVNVDNILNKFNNELSTYILSQEFLQDKTLEKEKKDFVRGFIDIACSYDGITKIASDYYSNTDADRERIMTFIIYDLIDIKYANFNLRTSDKTRCKKEQIRFDVTYYLNKFGTFSKYRMLVIANQRFDVDKYDFLQDEYNIYYLRKLPKELTDEEARENIDKFIKSYIQYLTSEYQNRIEKKLEMGSDNIDEFENSVVEDIREILNGDVEDKKQIRNEILKRYINKHEPDECVCCKGDLKDISYHKLLKENGTVREVWAFEVHHCIPFSCGEENVYDVPNNLVKICANCHSKIHYAIELESKAAIKNILMNVPRVLEYCKSVFGLTEIDDVVDETYKKILLAKQESNSKA